MPTPLAANTIIEYLVPGRNQYEILASDICYAGALVGIDTDGFLKPWANVATDYFVGIALETAAGSGATPAGTDTKCPVNDEGGIIKSVPVAGATTATSVGVDVFCTSDNVMADCALTATSLAIGRIIRFISSGVYDIQLYSAQEFHAAES